MKNSSIQKHIQSKHTQNGGTEKRSCPKCDYTCVEKKRLQYHLFKKHNDTSMGDLVVYKCKYCQHTDLDGYSMREHEKNVHEIKMGKSLLRNTRGLYKRKELLIQWV